MNNNDDTSPNTSFLLTNENKTIKYYKQIIPIFIHHFYISDEIDSIDPYLDMLNVLKCADQNDTIYIYLSSPGGSLYSSIQIISAISNSQATVITVLEGLVASAATFIFLSGDRFMVNPNCSFLIHNYSHYGLSGKGNEIISQVEYQKKYFRELTKNIYSKFLTEAEHLELCQGKDFWFSSDDVIKRLKNLNKLLTIDNSTDDLSPKKVKKKVA